MQKVEEENLQKIMADPTSICDREYPTDDERWLAEDIARRSSDEERKELLMKDPRFIQYIVNPTLDEQKFVIFYLKDWKKYLKEPDVELTEFRLATWIYHHPIIIP
jgi:hypothetical protein